jgi:hypothetical protein
LEDKNKDELFEDQIKGAVFAEADIESKLRIEIS